MKRLVIFLSLLCTTSCLAESMCVAMIKSHKRYNRFKKLRKIVREIEGLNHDDIALVARYIELKLNHVEMKNGS
jgi:hypothetical protein